LEDKSLASVYGVNGSCALQSLKSFDPITCLPPDCMHDILKGVVPLCLSTVLQQLLQQGVITVAVVNDRLSRLKLVRIERANAPPLLPKTFPKTSLLGTASKLWVLLRILPYVIGDLVNEEDNVWEVYLLLWQICDIVFAPSVHQSWLSTLQQLIAEHNRLLVDTYDGASAMASERVGASATFLQHTPLAFYFHCASHCLNLSASQAVSDGPCPPSVKLKQ